MLRCLFFTLNFLVINFSLLASWQQINIGINHNLNSVIYYDQNIYLATDNGIYYALNEGLSESDWDRYDINNNPEDSIIYNNTSFTNTLAYYPNVYFCGTDTVNQKAIIFKLSINTLEYEVFYEGPPNSSLNKINDINGVLHGVGNNGFYVTIRHIYNPVSIVVHDFNTNLNFLNIIKNNVTPTGLSILTENGYFDFRFYNDEITFLDYYEHADKNFKNFYMLNSTTRIYIGDDYYRFQSHNISQNTNFREFDNLEATCLLNATNPHGVFLGTNKGIFFAPTLFSNVFEWMPSSQNFKINDIFRVSSNPFYACGDNGVLLKHVNSTPITKPFVKLNREGGACISSDFSVQTTLGSANSCQYILNNQTISFLCNSPVLNIDSSGEATLTLIGTNSHGYSDTSTIEINIVDRPNNNIVYNISDSILCKSEPIIISLDSSENNVFYQLREIGNFVNNYGESNIGNSNPLNFETSFINTSGNYFLRAINNNALSCTNDFIDIINILVEHTQADFHQNKINVNVDEEVKFFNLSEEADFFNWSFNPNAEEPLSVDIIVSNSFNSLIRPNIQLIATSSNGCSDTVVRQGPVIYDNSSLNQECWANVNYGEDLSWQGSYGPYDVSKLADSKTGYLITGNVNSNHALASQLGDSVTFFYKEGFLAKYDLDGVLKWQVKSKDLGYYSQANFRSVIEDSLENIYVSGSGRNFTDNTGKTYLINNFTQFNNFIVKLNSVGEVVWIKNMQFSIHDMKLGKENNIILNCSPLLNYNASEEVYLNDSLFYSLSMPNFGSNIRTQFFTRIDLDGNYINHFTVSCNSVNGFVLSIKDFEVDDLNNVIVAGEYELSATFYDSNNNIVLLLDYQTQPQNFTRKSFIAKYDKFGNLLWHNHLYPRTQIHSITIPKSSNEIFFTAKSTQSPSLNLLFLNADSTIDSINSVGYLVGNISSNGILNWTNKADNINNYRNSQIYSNDSSVYVLIQGPNVDPFLSQTIGFKRIFSSIGHEFIEVELSNTAYFISEYDYDGHIKRLVVSDTLNPLTSYFFRVRPEDFPNTGFFQNDNGDFYLGHNLEIFNIDSLNVFGTNISTNGTDGVISKFSYNCTNSHFPIYKTEIEENICFGDEYILPNGTIINSFLNDTIVEFQYTSSNGLDSLVVYNLTKLTLDTTYLDTILFCDSILYNSQWYFSSIEIIESFSNQNNCDSIVFLQLKKLNEISGTILTNNNIPLTNSMVYMVNVDTSLNSIFLIDSSFTNTNGEFSFNILNQINYIKAIPNEILFPNQIPTYYSSSPLIQSANYLNCGTDILFNTIEGVNPGGSGFISGFIFEGSGKLSELGQPVNGLNVLLVNGNDEIYLHTTSNNDGYFEFLNIPCDTFRLWVDDILTNNYLSPLITLSNQNCFKDSLLFERRENKLNLIHDYLGLNKLTSDIESIKVYPLPFKDELTVDFKNLSFYSVNIYNLNGQLIYSKSFKSQQTFIIKTNSWVSGVYYLSVESDSGIFRKTMIKLE